MASTSRNRPKSRLRLSRSATALGGIQAYKISSPILQHNFDVPPTPPRRSIVPSQAHSRHNPANSVSSSEYSLSVALAPPPCEAPLPRVPTQHHYAYAHAFGVQEEEEEQQLQRGMPFLHLQPNYPPKQGYALSYEVARGAHDLVAGLAGVGTRRMDGQNAGIFGRLPAESLSSDSHSLSTSDSERRSRGYPVSPHSQLQAVASTGRGTRSRTNSFRPIELLPDVHDSFFDAPAYRAESETHSLLDEQLDQLLQAQASSQQHTLQRPTRERDPTIRAVTSQSAIDANFALTPTQLRRRSRSVTKIITQDARHGERVLSTLQSPASSSSLLAPASSGRRQRCVSTSEVQDGQTALSMSLNASPRQFLVPKASVKQGEHWFSRTRGDAENVSPSAVAATPKRSSRARASSFCPPPVATAHTVHSSPTVGSRSTARRTSVRASSFTPFSVLPSLRPQSSISSLPVIESASLASGGTNSTALPTPKRPPRSAKRASMLIPRGHRVEGIDSSSGYSSSEDSRILPRSPPVPPLPSSALQPQQQQRHTQLSRSRSPLASTPPLNRQRESLLSRRNSRSSACSGPKPAESPVVDAAAIEAAAAEVAAALEEEAEATATAKRKSFALLRSLAHDAQQTLTAPEEHSRRDSAKLSSGQASTYTLIAVEDTSASFESRPVVVEPVASPQPASLHAPDDGIEWEMMTSPHVVASPAFSAEFEAYEEPMEELPALDADRRSAIEMWRQLAERYDGDEKWNEAVNEVESVHDTATDAATRAEVSDEEEESEQPFLEPSPAADTTATQDDFTPFEFDYEFKPLPAPTPAADVCGPSTPVPGAWLSSFPSTTLGGDELALGSRNTTTGLGLTFEEQVPPVALEAKVEEAAADSDAVSSADAFESADEGSEQDWGSRSPRGSRHSRAMSFYEVVEGFERKHGYARGSISWRASVRFSHMEKRRSLHSREATDSRRLSVLGTSREEHETPLPFPEVTRSSEDSPELHAAPASSESHLDAHRTSSEMPDMSYSASHSSQDGDTPLPTPTGLVRDLPSMEAQRKENDLSTETITLARLESPRIIEPPCDPQYDAIAREHAEAGAAFAARRLSRRYSKRVSVISASPVARNKAENRKSTQAFKRLTAMINVTPCLLIEPPAQTSWRSTLHPHMWEQLSSQFGAKEMHRQEVIWELCATERSFVQNLCSIQRVFSLPLRTADGRWTPGVPNVVARLFDWLDDILQLHSKLSASLDRARAAHPSPVVVHVAQSALKHVESLVVHQPYLVRFEEVARTIETVLNSPEPCMFANFVRSQLTLPECGSMSLSSFLLKPVQRLMKYPLFFKQLLELTPPAHPDHEATGELHKQTEHLIRDMNDVKAREEDYADLISLESRMSGLPDGFFLASRYRQLVHQGSLRWVQLTDAQRAQLADGPRTPSEMTSPIFAHEQAAEHARPSPRLPTSSNFRPLNLSGSRAPTSRPARSHLSSVQTSSPSEAARRRLPSSVANGAADMRGREHMPHSPSMQSDASLTSAANSPMMPHSPSFTPQATPPMRSAPLAPPRSMSRKSSMANLFLRTSSKAAERERERQTNDAAVHLQAFVFSDAVILSLPEKSPPTEEPAPKGKTRARTPTSPVPRERAPTPSLPTERYTALESVGLARVLSVTDHSGKCAEHEFLLELEVLPYKVEGVHGGARSQTRPSSGPASFFFSFSPFANNGERRNSKSPETECTGWLRALERSLLASVRTTKRQSILFSNPTSPLSPSFNGDQPKAAHAEWPRRKAHVTELVMAAAKMGDRGNLVALLQSGLPYPRSPSHQDLADTASEVLNSVLQAREGIVSPQLAPRGVATVGNSVLDDVEEEREERRWWTLRLAEVRRDAQAQRDIDAMVEGRAAAREAARKASPMLTNAKSPVHSLGWQLDGITPPRRSVRRGLPVLSTNSPDPEQLGPRRGSS